MQAGLVKRLSFSDIFTARGFSLRVFVAVVCASLTPTSQDLTRSSRRGSAGRPIQGEWPPNQQLMTQAPLAQPRLAEHYEQSGFTHDTVISKGISKTP